MGDRDLHGYSLMRALKRLADRKPLDGLERECSDRRVRGRGRRVRPNGFRIPEDVMQFRTLGTSPFSAAGALVINEPQGQSMIEMLRNNMVVAQLGARILNGLVGNLPIPSQTGGATASWLSETATSASSNQTVGQLTLTPHRLAAETAYTYPAFTAKLDRLGGVCPQ